MMLVVKTIIIVAILVIGVLAYAKLFTEYKKQKELIFKSNQQYDNERIVLAGVVARNKLRNRGTNIDTIVAYLESNGIEAKYEYCDGV